MRSGCWTKICCCCLCDTVYNFALEKLFFFFLSLSLSFEAQIFCSAKEGVSVWPMSWLTQAVMTQKDAEDFWIQLTHSRCRLRNAILKVPDLLPNECCIRNSEDGPVFELEMRVPVGIIWRWLDRILTASENFCGGHSLWGKSPENCILGEKYESILRNDRVKYLETHTSKVSVKLG